MAATGESKAGTGVPGSAFGPEWAPAGRVEDLARRLVAIPSETGSPDEAAFADGVAEILREIPYFRDNPQDIRIRASHGDPAARNVVAIVRGSGARAMLLAGHYDTASIANYHDLAPLACSPDALREALIADLRGRGDRNAQEARALADLESGDFLPGRGMLDMKSGLAAGIAALERFAARPDRRGSLVFCCTPDEERDSRGMRALRDWLPELMRECGLDPVGAINLDATSDQGDGADGRAVYAGSVGKLMPFALVVGRSAHASYPFEGVSAQLVATEIARRMEMNADLADDGDGFVSPPPICLEARDLRDVYEVTTPERVWLAFNWLYHAMPPETLFSRFREQVGAGCEAAMAAARAQAAAYAAKSGALLPPLPASARLLTYAELRAMAAREVGENFESLMAARQAELDRVDNPLTASRELSVWLVDRAKLQGPAVVTGFASLHYPATALDPRDPADRALREAVEATLGALAGDPARALVWRRRFEGVSDMSFFGRVARGASGIVAANTPPLRLVDRPAATAFRCPMVNIGPWGREFHQRLERVHAPYAFDALPRIVADIADRMLSRDG